MRKVLAFGAFDPLHPGHVDFLRQAKALGNFLTVVVARDSAIRAHKEYEPHQPEAERVAAVSKVEYVDEAKLGHKAVHKYEILGELDFDVIALGYDQEPSEEVVKHELKQHNKYHIEVVRLKPFHPEQYKSTFIREQI